MALLGRWEGERAEAWRQLWSLSRLEIHDQVDSTNNRGRELLGEWDGSWWLILAETQTGGKGRGGKQWFSPPGSGLWFTLLLPSGREGWDTLLPLRVGLAVARACDQILREGGAPTPKTLLKWPNDLLMEDRKIGGILCETTPDSGVLVGVGINVRVDPEDFPAPLRDSAGALAGLVGVPVSRGRLLGRILQEMRAGAVEGREDLSAEERGEYRTRDALQGRRVRSEIGGLGIARGLTRKGSLLLEKDDGSRIEVRAGSVELVV